MIARRAVLAALLLLPPLCAQAQPEPPAELLRQVNTQRTQAGLGALGLDPRLERVAAEHAADLARRDRLDHRNGAGEDLGRRLARVGYAWRIAAENVARGGIHAHEVLSCGWPATVTGAI